MIRTKLALKVLMKKEQKHLTSVANIHSMKKFITTREVQIKTTKKSLQDGMPIGIAEACWECRLIAQKLGLE